jgi:acyl transferase domain-containing protein
MSKIVSRFEPLSPVKQALLAVEQMKARLEAAERRQREPIAIVGIGCRFPGHANSASAFWDLLANGISAVTRIPRERWDVEAYYNPDPDAAGKAYTQYGAFVDDVDTFDAAFFNIAPIEAISMDPQQRMLLEVSWEALEHAGLAGEASRGSRTGVFTGICSSDYMLHTIGSRETQRLDAFSGTGSASSVAVGRLSYFYDFHGPNFPIDTACSSSLVALHLAVQSLRNHECDMALATGVSAMLSPDLYVYFSKTRALSPGPECRTFDARADGYVRGEGCGVMVLKRLSDARSDGDAIIAVIRGSAMNHDGRTSGLTAPNGPAQQSVIRAALANAGIVPGDVTYVETHGTGTPLGDPIEVLALGAAYRSGEEAEGRKLFLGSVKTNIGHLEGAAGIAAAIKAALMLQQRELVPHLHFEQPSPYIPWSELPIEVVTTRQPWPEGQPLVAGISSFGFSGTNVHVIIEAASEGSAGTDQAPDRQRRAQPAQSDGQATPYVLPLSARSGAALKRLAGLYGEHFQQRPALPLEDVCHTAGVGRAHLRHRLAVVGADLGGMAARLDAFAQSGNPPAGLRAGSGRPKPPRIVFHFSGQGAQYAGMGRQIYWHQPLFRKALDQCDQMLRPQLGISVVAAMFGEPASAEASPGNTSLDETWLTQPALFVFEYALARLWQSWGIEPAAVAGHSIGEYVAACLAGVVDLEAALRLVVARGKLMQALPQDGAMLVAFAAESEVAPFLAGKQAVGIAAVNGPDNVVISGRRDTVMAAGDELEAAGIGTHALRVSHAFHSPLVEPMLGEFQRIASEIDFRQPQLPLIANLTGGLVEPQVVPDAVYWTQHVRQPVRYYAGLETLLDNGFDTFLEIGPRPILTDLGRRYTPKAAQWLASCRPDGELETLFDALAALYVSGCAVRWDVVYARSAHRPTRLPTYPFERKRYWLDRPTPASARQPQPDAAADNAGQTPMLNAFVDVLE